MTGDAALRDAIAGHSERGRIGARLTLAATAVLALLPVAMVVANRSSPLLLGLALVLASAAAVATEGPAALARALPTLRAPLPAAVCAFLAFALMSIVWSPSPSTGARSLGEFALALAAGTALVGLLGARLPASSLAMATAGIVTGSALLLLSLATDLAPQRLLGLRVDYSAFNRGALTVVALALPVTWLNWRAGRRSLAVLTGLAASVAAFRSESTTAALATLVASASWAAVCILGRRLSLRVGGAAIGAALLLAPVAGDLLARGVPDSAHRILWSANSGARVAIARAFGAAVREDPWRGMGFGASAKASETPVADALPPEFRLMLAAGHPHNAALQIWAELGLAGVVLAAAALFLLVGAIAAPDPQVLAPRLALVALTTAVMLVGHGAWQGWWVAVVAASATWLSAGSRIGPGA